MTAAVWRDAFDFGRLADSGFLEGEVARRTLRLGAFICGVAAALFALLYHLGGPAEFVAPNVAAALVLWVIAALPVRDATLPIYAAVTLGLVLFGYQLLLVAGVDNGIAVWFLVPNLAAMILGMRRLTAYCASASAATLVGIVVAARAGWIVPRVALPQADLVMAASMIGVLLVCGLFALVALRARRRLLREVAARNEALARALDEAQAARRAALDASRSKERFFANLTHEIRTPLNGIAGTAELLQRTALSAEQRPLAAALGASTANLVELVNAMLDHAKLAAGHVAVEPGALELRTLARDMHDLFAAQARGKGLAFEVAVAEATPGWIVTDAIKLRQIVANLVSNAVRFTCRGGITLRIRCEAAAGAGLRLVVEVADTGVGIAGEQLDAIFAPFVQGDPSIGRAFGGTGLGLAIARQLAELLAGTIEVASRPGEGATFTLALPVVPAPAPAPAAPARRAGEAAPAGGLAVLLVEDNAVNQLVARTMLEALALEVSVAADGAGAVAQAEARDHALILMDLQMPGMDGIAATREIRRRERLSGRRRVPIVALTGNSPDDYGEACRAAGMDGFLTKPVTIAELRTLVAGLAAPR